jgi:transposase
MKTRENSILSAGIDTGKHKLDVAIHGTAKSFVVENSPNGWQSLAARFAAAGVNRIGIEATGGYERGVTRHLQAQGFTVLVLQPLQVRAFAQLRLQRAKNDRIDAGLIAACVHLLDPSNKLPPEPRFDALADHLTFLEQIEDDITRIKTRLEHIHDPRLRRIAEADCKRLEQRRERETARLLAELRAHADLARRFVLVCSIPGCGERTALSIVIRMPELGQLGREQVAAIAGLAPFVHQSGTYAGETHIGGGRSRLRRALYRAALPAAFRWNQPLMALYRRLRDRGKTHSCALIACARKLLIYANAVVERGSPWESRPALG